MSIIQLIMVVLCFVCTYKLAQFMENEKPENKFKEFRQFLNEEEQKRDRLNKK